MINAKGNSRNTMRVRNLMLNTIVRSLEDEQASIWDSICEDALFENNEATSRKDVAFAYLGEYYPSSVANSLRKAILNRKSSELHDSLKEDFEALRVRFVDEWNVSLRNFRNMLSVVFREAQDQEQLESVLPNCVLPKIEGLDFLPLQGAKGIDSARIKELRTQYPEAWEIEAFISAGKLM